MNTIPSFRWLLSELLWSPIGAPIRTLRGTRRKSVMADATQAGPRLGWTLSVDTRNELVTQMLAHKVPAAKSVLDIGCAGGTLAPVLMRAGFTRYHGIDISRHAIETARGHFAKPGVTFEQSDADGFRSEDQYDVIVFAEMLYYVDFAKVGEIILEQSKRLTPNGVLCISLNLHAKSRAIQRKIDPLLEYVAGFLYQEKTGMDCKVRRNRERPLFHTFLARPLGKPVSIYP